MYNSYDYEKAKIQATRKANKFLKDKGFKYSKIRCRRGVFFLDNPGAFLTAVDVLEKSTNFKFNIMSDTMARLEKTQFNND